jgi:peptide/nickel transport system permease protein
MHIWIQELRMNKKHNKESQFVVTCRRLMRNKLALWGLTIILIIVFVGILAPYLALQDPLKQDFRLINKRTSTEHLFGTDQMGRDI